MEITAEEIITELQKQFPKELTICVQAIQIRKYQAKEHSHDQNDSDSTE